MRNVPSDIASKLAMKKQTRANKADPSANIWIGRPTTPLVDNTFLERQTVTNASITDVSVAVCHPRAGKVNTKTYLAYITNGKVKVAFAQHKAKMANHIWVDTGFSENNATSVSIAFDGTMPKARSGNVEFVTEQEPWIFWSTSDGKLLARKLGTSNTITLAEANCTDVSAIRAMWSEVGRFDFGLITFFILSGTLFYRQFINDVWMDAEVITFGPSGAIWKEIAAFRTWDYRVGIQAKTTSNQIFELFTQYMGIGKQTTEHAMDVSNIKITKSDLITIHYYNFKNKDEKIQINNIINIPYLQWGLPVFGIYVENIKNNEDDWGEYILVTLDHPCNINSLLNNQTAFSLTDEKNVSFYSYEVTSLDGSQLLIRFLDFNNAFGECVLKYTPGNISSPPYEPYVFMNTWQMLFAPVNLNPPQVDPPEPEDIWNE